MSLATYSDLQTAIATLLHRADLTSAITDWIALAEADFHRKLRLSAMETVATVSVSGETGTLPSDFLEMRKIFLDSSTDTELRYMPPQQMIKYWGGSASSGEPQFYSIQAGALYLAPIPNGNYSLVIDYYAKFDALSNSNTTNWLLTNHPDIYLYGAAVHSAPYIQNDSRLPMWQQMYGMALEGAQISDRRSVSSGSLLEMRAV